MNIIDIIKNLLKSNNSLDIININNAINIPTREIFKNNNNILNNINKYKNEYINTLHKFKSIKYSKENEFQNNFSMYLELIFNIIYKTDSDTQNYKYKSNVIKLYLYLDELNKLELENTEKLIALNELRNEKRLKINSNILNDELNKLISNYIIFKSQTVAVHNETKNYILNSGNKEENTSEMYKEYSNLFSTASEFINIDYLNSVNTSIENKTALIEKELELYVYKHKNIISELNNELKLISEIEINNSNYYITLERIKYIEKIYILFNTYGRNIITNEMFENLYKIKFNILTYDINEAHTTPFLLVNSDEMKYYEKIVMDKINDLITSDKYNDEIMYIKSYLKNDKVYDPEEILKNKVKLSFLLDLEKDNGINYFFENCKTYGSKEFCPIKGYKCEPYPPIGTLCFFIHFFFPTYDCYDSKIYYNNPNKNYCIPPFITEELRKIYSIYNDKLNKRMFKIPEGITNIGEYSEPSIAQQFNNNLKNKDIILPSTMKTFKYDDTRNNILDTKIICNDGLKSLEYTLSSSEIRFIVLSPTIENLKLDLNNNSEIIFKDYKISKILNNKDKLIKLLSEIYEIENHTMINLTSTKKYDKLEEIDNGIYRPAKILKIKSNIKYLTLVDEMNNTFTISKDELEMNIIKMKNKYNIRNIYFFDHEVRWNVGLTDQDYNEIYENFMHVINEKTKCKIENNIKKLTK